MPRREDTDIFYHMLSKRHHNKSYDFEKNKKYRENKKKSAEMREESFEAI